jgi:hypothetical protein
MCVLGAYGISPKAVEDRHTVSRLKSADWFRGLPEHSDGRRRTVLGFTRAREYCETQNISPTFCFSEATDHDLMAMLQTLLAERFRLALQREAKPIEAYVLEVGRIALS